jgi:hypothetical protein
VPQPGGVVAVVVVEPTVLDVIVTDEEETVVVVVTEAPQESQQLAFVPTVPRIAAQRWVELVTLQRVWPCRVTQHVA